MSVTIVSTLPAPPQSTASENALELKREQKTQDEFAARGKNNTESE
jgi:hypothetical protein